jgi:hypothetical protein
MCASILVLSYLKMKEILYAAVTLVITIAANAQKKKPIAPAMLDVSQLGGTKIPMSETTHNYGNGYCQHERDLEVQLTKNEILIHETIYNDKGDQNSDGYRWI